MGASSRSPRRLLARRIFHEDAASAVVAALGVPGGIYEVCDDEPLTREEFGRVCAGTLGVAAPKPIPRSLGAVGVLELMSRSLRLSNAKLRAATAWAHGGPASVTGFQRRRASSASPRSGPRPGRRSARPAGFPQTGCTVRRFVFPGSFSGTPATMAMQSPGAAALAGAPRRAPGT